MRKMFLAAIGAIGGIYLARKNGQQLQAAMGPLRDRVEPLRTKVEDTIPGISRAKSTTDAWGGHESSSLNAVELPPADAARSQHEQPMHNSEDAIDPAHTAH